MDVKLKKELNEKLNIYRIVGILFSVLLAILTPMVVALLTIAGSCGDPDGAGLGGAFLGLLLAPIVGILGIYTTIGFTKHGDKTSRNFIIIYIISVPLLVFFLGSILGRDPRTSLMKAASIGNSNKVYKLLSKGKDPDKKICYKGGNTYALKEAIEGNHFETVKVLVSNGANVNLESFYPPITIASKIGNEKILKYLITEGARVDEKIYYGHTPLMIAAEKGHTKIVEILIDNGANVNFETGGASALKIACYEDNEEVAKLLLNKGADIKILDESGCKSWDKIKAELPCD